MYFDTRGKRGAWAHCECEGTSVKLADFFFFFIEKSEVGTVSSDEP